MLCYGYGQADARRSRRPGQLLELPPEVRERLTKAPDRRPAGPWPPTDPFIYRFYEVVMLYGPVLKDVCHEMFGDGIMSAIDMSLDVQKVQGETGDERWYCPSTANGSATRSSSRSDRAPIYTARKSVPCLCPQAKRCGDMGRKEKLLVAVARGKCIFRRPLPRISNIARIGNSRFRFHRPGRHICTFKVGIRAFIVPFGASAVFAFGAPALQFSQPAQHRRRALHQCPERD